MVRGMDWMVEIEGNCFAVGVAVVDGEVAVVGSSLQSPNIRLNSGHIYWTRSPSADDLPCLMVGVSTRP